MSLVLDENEEFRDEIPSVGCFKDLFNNCNAIVSVSEDFLPATTLKDSCYARMFLNCNSLLNAPKLSAETLCNGCYKEMFRNCNSLNSTVDLPAKELKNDCYTGMFENCYALQGLNLGFEKWLIDAEAGPIATNGWLTEACVNVYNPLITCTQALYDAQLQYPTKLRGSSLIPPNIYVEFSNDADNIIDAGPGLAYSPGDEQAPAEPQEPQGSDPSEEQAIIPEPEQTPDPLPASPDPDPTD